MTRIVAAIFKLLNVSARGVAAGVAYVRGDVLRKYVFVSLIIHIVLVTALSISYSRAIKPIMPNGPYEVALIDLEEQSPKKTIQKPAPQKTEPKPQPVVKKEEPKKKQEPPKQQEEQQKEVVKIKSTPKKPPEDPKKKDLEPKKEEPVPKKEPEAKPEETEAQAPAPEDQPAPKEEPEQTPGVGGFQVDSPNFNFNYYLELLRDKIQKNWRPPSGMPSNGEFITATVNFTIRRDGMIIGAGVEESSGLAFFDQSALRAVLNSNPAPPLPRAYDEDRLGVHVSFVFGKGGP